MPKIFQKKRMIALTMVGLCLTFTSIVRADDNAKEQERVKESGNVMMELANASSGIPVGLLNKAECVIVLPSVKKAGFIVGASYGRGVMTCRGGADFPITRSPDHARSPDLDTSASSVLPCFNGLG